MQLTLCPLLLCPNSANCWKGTSPLMEPGGQWRIIWSQVQDMNNKERCLLSSHYSLIVPYKVSHRRQSSVPRCSREARSQGEPYRGGFLLLSPHAPGLTGPRAPTESFIFSVSHDSPSLINTCPGVSFSEAEAAFFKQALLIGGGRWGVHMQAEANIYTVLFLNPSSQRYPQDPWGTVSWTAVRAGCLPCRTYCLSSSHAPSPRLFSTKR